MRILEPHEVKNLALPKRNPALAVRVHDRRKTTAPTAPKLVYERTTVQVLPCVTEGARARDRELPRYLSKYPKGAERESVEAGVALAILQGLHPDLPCPALQKLADNSPHAALMRAERERQHGRILISPRALSPKILRLYVEALAVTALAPSTEVQLPLISPNAIAVFLGGIGHGGLDRLCREVFNAFGYDVPAQEVKLSDAMATVGFGPDIPHQYFPVSAVPDMDLNRLNQTGLETDDLDYLGRLGKVGKPSLAANSDKNANKRLDWLRGLDRGIGFADYVIRCGAMAAGLNDRLAKVRNTVAVKTLTPFVPAAHCIGRQTLTELRKHPNRFAAGRRISNQTFIEAVRMVFEGSWFDLDLGGTLDSLADDVKVQMAREIISALSSTGCRSYTEHLKISDVQLLGMALATGIPVGNLVRFAIQDRKRRGDTFLAAQTLKKIYDPEGLIDDLLAEDDDGIISGAYRCAGELEELYFELLSLEEDSAVKPRERWNRKLRQGNSTLWSHKSNNRYFLDMTRRNADDEEQEYYLVYPDKTLVGVRPGDLL